jgi:bisphosphoglycerate-dependent phosphoglycerate mutase
VEHAARLLMEGGYKIDVVFSSRLKRAIRSVWILLQEFNEVYLPVFKSWRLNERMVSETMCRFYRSMGMNSNVYLNIYKSINPPLVSFSMVL